MSSSSSSSHATVTYTSISSDDDLPSWGIPLMDAYEPETKAPTEDQSLPASGSPTTLSLDYSADSEPVEEDPEEDPEDDPEEEPSEEEEEEELSVSTDSPPAGLYIDLPSEVEEDKTPLPPYINALIEEWRTAPTPLSPSPSPSPLSPLFILLPRIPSTCYDLPSYYRDIIPDANMPLQKRARFAASSQRFEVGESSAAAAARHPESTLARGTESGFMTALQKVKESVTNIATRHKHDSEEFYVCHQDTQDDIAILRALVSTLKRER
ncbi:hypothetical protein Tco_1433332, partial [Tanacetum coccineum]